MEKNNCEKPLYQLVLCACPDEETAVNIAENIVAQRLAACVNVLPGVYSVYHWQGNVESAKENMLLIKTTVQRYASLEKVIKSLHPYEVPEIIAIDINSGLPEYLKWIGSSIT
ncbi:MAG: divalent-cation tolerance protein CutA [Gammaproteobacteria bacterium]|nr:divalent-cation tolerance protein CutA [Gammaproteobacteria bacterium]